MSDEILLDAGVKRGRVTQSGTVRAERGNCTE